MSTTVITIGLTESDLPHYSSFMDGYRPGAEQQQVLIPVPADLTEHKSLEDIAEAVFVAVNAPYPMESETLEYFIQDQWSDLRDSMASVGMSGLRSVSVGDTVSLGGDAETGHAVSCERIGWTKIKKTVQA